MLNNLICGTAALSPYQESKMREMRQMRSGAAEMLKQSPLTRGDENWAVLFANIFLENDGDWSQQVTDIESPTQCPG